MAEIRLESAFLAAIDERITRLEELVGRALCKCEIGPYWHAYHNCPIHNEFTNPHPNTVRARAALLERDHGSSS